MDRQPTDTEPGPPREAAYPSARRDPSPPTLTPWTSTAADRHLPTASSSWPPSRASPTARSAAMASLDDVQRGLGELQRVCSDFNTFLATRSPRPTRGTDHDYSLQSRGGGSAEGPSYLSTPFLGPRQVQFGGLGTAAAGPRAVPIDQKDMYSEAVGAQTGRRYLQTDCEPGLTSSTARYGRAESIATGHRVEGEVQAAVWPQTMSQLQSLRLPPVG